MPKNLAYRLRRAASLGRWKPPSTATSGHVDTFGGSGGVLVRPDFFDDAAFDIPETCWMVDDIWLSAQLARRGIPIWLSAEGKLRTQGTRNEVAEVALRHQVVRGLGRPALNQACIDRCRRAYGIWGGTAAIDG